MSAALKWCIFNGEESVCVIQPAGLSQDKLAPQSGAFTLEIQPPLAGSNVHRLELVLASLGRLKATCMTVKFEEREREMEKVRCCCSAGSLA